MKIGMIGAGNVGGSLAQALAAKGYEIVFGVRDPQSEKIQALLREMGESAQATAIADAVAQTEVIILATPWNATQDAIAAAGDWQGKILIDTTNPIALGMEGLAQGLVIGHTTSAAEEIAQWATGARVVKAFNNIGANCYANPQFGGIPATAFICGDDAEAKQVVSQLAEAIGFAVVDTGNLPHARLLEPLAMLWIDLAIFGGVGREFSISLIQR